MSGIPPVKISVLMPVYNAARYLAQAMESILAQTFRDFECIVVDDGSSDRSLRVLQRFAQKDGRVKIISRPNTGIVGALNDGLAVATGEYIARMDADDIAYSDRLEIQLRYIESHPEIVAIGSGVRMVDPNGAPLKDFHGSNDPQILRNALIAAKDIGIIHPTLMVRRSVLEAFGGYRKQYNFVEDFDLFLRLLDMGELGNAPEVLLDYRQHLQSTNSTRHERQTLLMNQCVAEHRRRWNLPALESLPMHEPMTNRGSQHVLWASWAMEGGHPWTALRHAAIACFRSGLAPEARKCFNYTVFTLCHR